jgi:hypothetical protein
VLDFAGPEAASAGFLARWLHSRDLLRDNAEDRILALMSRAGLAEPKKVGQGAMLLGRIAYYRASEPSGAGGAERGDATGRGSEECRDLTHAGSGGGG